MRKGASMVEVVVTVAVLGILTTIGYSAYMGIIEGSRRKVCEQNQIVIMQALRQYLYRYPRSATPLNLRNDLTRFVGDPSVFRCPCDGNGYAYNNALAVINADRWVILDTPITGLIATNAPILCDSDNITFASVATIDRTRHGRVNGQNVGVAVSFTNVRYIGNNLNWTIPLRDRTI
ncbi:MAG: prepilin-type N-terminal cleavage/methylation domain-containing protein [Candidatus Omnitrophota bacterium]